MEGSRRDSTMPQVAVRRGGRVHLRVACYNAVTEKGNLTLILFVVLCMTGVILRLTLAEHPNEKWCRTGTKEAVTCYLLSFSLFGFSGGFTNWLAIIMLFRKVPLLYGSGVIPSHYKQIGQSIKQIILDYIFDSTFLNQYLIGKLSAMAATADIPERINTLLASDEVDGVIETQLASVADLPEGQFLNAVGIRPASLKPMIKPFVLGMGSEVAPLLLDHMSQPGKVIRVDYFRDELDRYMTHRVELMDEKHTTALLEKIIRPHLGWLIVWGAAFGALLGLIAQAARVAPEY